MFMADMGHFPAHLPHWVQRFDTCLRIKGDLETNASKAPDGHRYRHQNLVENLTMQKTAIKKNRMKNWVAKRMVLTWAKVRELISRISPKGLTRSSISLDKNEITGKSTNP